MQEQLEQPREGLLCCALAASLPQSHPVVHTLSLPGCAWESGTNNCVLHMERASHTEQMLVLPALPTSAGAEKAAGMRCRCESRLCAVQAGEGGNKPLRRDGDREVTPAKAGLCYLAR